MPRLTARLIVVICTFTTTVLIAVRPAHAQCSNSCGGHAATAACWCDEACMAYGDCCPDYVATCRLPQISAVTPVTLPTSGGVITITGGGFGSPGSVRSVAADGTTNNLAVNFWSSSEIRAIMPEGVGLGYRVTVVNHYGDPGTSSPNKTFGFAAPTIAQVSPSTGPTVGGFPITVYGANFGVADAIVTFGGAVLEPLDQWHTELVFTLPPGAGQFHPLTVQVGGQTSKLATFSYVPPSIASIDPPSLPVAGGIITINGSNFGPPGEAQVWLDQTPLDVSTSGHAQIVVEVPPGSGAQHQLTLEVAGLVIKQPITYAAPVVFAVGGSAIPTAGGSVITLHGLNFAEPASVTLDGQTCTEVTLVDATELTCLTPAGEGANKELTLTCAGQRSPSHLVSYAPPTITKVSPNIAPESGGIPITILGANFGLDPTVTIGGAPATVLTGATHTRIVVTPPSVTGSNLPVRVTAGGQTSNVFFGYSTAFSITSIEPERGPTSGGFPITIHGGDFSPGQPYAITVGAANCPLDSVADASTIVCTAPAGSGSDLPVVVRDGALSTPPFIGFSYETRPIISSISPPSAPTSGNVPLTINGFNFGPSATATLGGSACTPVEPPTFNELRCVAPPGQGRQQELVVVANGEVSAPSLDFSYDPPVISEISPPAGPTTGGFVVTLTGANFGLTGQVQVGGRGAPTLSWSHSCVAVFCPAGEGSSETVELITGGQRSNTGTFAYDEPVISAISPGPRPTIGGPPITIHGANFGTKPTVLVENAVASLAEYSHDHIVFLLPPGEGVNKPVSVQAGDQVAMSSISYTGPRISSISPQSGTSTATGGVPITITGTDFGFSPTVRIGQFPAAILSQSHTRIVAEVPSGGGALLPVTVEVAGQVAIAAQTFSYPPIITEILPASAPTAGGAVITLHGANFAATSSVTVGGVTCPLAEPATPTELLCTLPPGEGVGHVVQVNSAGLVATASFNYAPPEITSISPASGPVAGNVPITIVGTNFGLSPEAFIGDRPAPILMHSHSEMRVQLPRGEGEELPVIVRVAGQVSEPAGDFFSYGPRGDGDGDRDIDLDDLGDLTDCLSGPQGGIAEAYCLSLDIDADADVDLYDFLLFQRFYTGTPR